MIDYNIRIDIQSERTIYTDMVLTSGDTKAYQLNFLFYSSGKKIDVTEYILCIRAKRADGAVIIDKGERAEDGELFYRIKSNIYDMPGVMTMEVALANQAGSYVTTKELVLTVRQGYGNGGLTAKNTVPILAGLAEQSARTEQIVRDAGRLANMEVRAETLDGNSQATASLYAEGEKMVLLLGIPRGQDGAEGLPGRDGYTPQKGVDYFTEADKSDMVNDVLAALPNGDEVSY